MFFGKKKRNAQTAKGSDASASGRLLIHISDSQWSYRLLKEESNEVLKEDKGKVSPSDDQDGLLAAITAFMKQSTKLDQKQIGEIEIAVDDKDLFYLDPRNLTNVDFEQKDQVIDTLSVVSGVERAAYGMRRRSDTPGQIMVADAEHLKSRLAALDQLGLLVTKVVPLADLILPEPQQIHELTVSTPTIARAYMSKFDTLLIICNQGDHRTLIRSLPIGWGSFTESLVTKGAVSEKEAPKVLQKKDLLGTIDLSITETDETMGDPIEDALRPTLQDYVERFETTITFMREQFQTEFPSSIDVFGDFDKVNGLVDVLKRDLKIELRPTEFDPLTVLQERQGMVISNLLSGTNESLISIGNATYSYDRDGVFVQDEEGTPKVGSRPAHKNYSPHIRINKSGSRRRATPPPRPSADQKQNRGFFGFGGGASKAKPVTKARAKHTDQTEKQDRQIFMLIGLLLIGGGYWGMKAVTETKASALNPVNSLITQQAKAKKVKSELHQVEGSSLLNLDVRADKVLWSEKFLSMARNMDKSMWLSDLYLENHSLDIGDETVQAQRLTFEGGLLPSTNGHILRIAEYIERLENDKDTFMSDFREITFGGAEVDSAETQDTVVRFTLHAWYDENKRLESKSSQKDGQVGGLKGMQDGVDQRNQATNDAISGAR